MDNGGDILRLCRLCLVKDDVNIPIFEEQGDIRQIFLKISSCLPVKVSREDKLPKKICDGCSYKLDMLYEFWNTTANAEKQLLSWLGEAGMNAKMADGTISAVAQQIKPVETFVKQEAIDPSDVHADDNDDDKSYMFQQKFAVEEAGPSATVTSNEEEPPPKRARRTAAVKAQIAMDPESDDDDDSGEPITKVEDESEESEGDDHEPPFVDVPSTSADDQPGPSGVGKDGVEAPSLIGDGKQMTCEMCNETFQLPDEFNQHLATHAQLPHIHASKEKISRIKIKAQRNYVPPIKENGKFGCTNCGKEYSTKTSLAEHYETAHESNRYSCEICKKLFPTKYKLKLHQLVHDPNRKKIECPVCLKQIAPVWYRTHKKMHKNVDKELFKCDLCDKPFGSSIALNIHKQNVHLKNHRYVCDKCGQKFQHKASLLLHDANKHQDTPRECSICHKLFKTETSLRKHLRCHDPKFKKTQCPVCLKVLSARTVKIHEEMHAVAKERNAICDICGKTIAYRSNLKLHMRTHTGEKPYSCDKCGKCFSKSSTLVAHKRTHTNERPFICKVCNRGFTQKTPLKVHMRCHTGERPYACQICSKGFTTRVVV